MRFSLKRLLVTVTLLAVGAGLIFAGLRELKAKYFVFGGALLCAGFNALWLSTLVELVVVLVFGATLGAILGPSVW